MMNDVSPQKDKARDESNRRKLCELWKKPFQFSSKDLSSFTSNFDTEIGFDGYGKVYKGQLPTGVKVAVKVLQVENVDKMTLMTVVNTFDRTYHRNLVKLYGFCFDDKVKALVYEYMENGSLDMCLYENHLNIKWDKLYDIAVDTAKGLSYLHVGCEEQIIHYDIKPSSVLLDSNFSPKIGNFGSAKIINRDISHCQVDSFAGCFPYAAPEIFMPYSEITEKCDVYSFGMLLFEILGRRNNQSKIWFPIQVWEALKNGHINELIMDCGITKENREKARILCLIALWCVQFTPRNRPSMNTVVIMLRRDIHVVPMPPNPIWAASLSGLAFSHEVISSILSPAIDRVQDKEKLGESVEDSISQEFASEAPFLKQPLNIITHYDKSLTVMENNPARLPENWAVLSREMAALNNFMEEVASKKALQMAAWLAWLDNVRSKAAEDFDALQYEYNQFKNGNLNARHRLNSKVNELRRSVNILKEVGNAVSDRIEMLCTDLSEEKLKRFSHANLRSFTSNFTTLIDNQRNGYVYKGQFPNGVQIVVKKLVEKDAAENIFMAEMKTMFKTSHRNLVKFYGFCFERNIKALVFEYMTNGSLDKILYAKRNDIKFDQLYKIVIETSKALSYLHDGCDEQLIHGDVKASNVLLDSDLSPKVTNFGVSKLMSRDLTHVTMSMAKGDPSYAAPEMMQSLHLTSKCDVYSFGMMLFEVLGRRRNIQGKVYFPRLVWNKFEKREAEEIMKECRIPVEDRANAMILCLVAFWCVQYTPENRPSMSTVVKILEKEIKVTMAPNPFSPCKANSVTSFRKVVYELLDFAHHGN